MTGPVRNLTVLVVDDDDGMRLALEFILENSGYRVLTASDGMGAVKIYREQNPLIDLVICDVKMPFMDGLETFRNLKSIRSDVRMIFGSGFFKSGMRAELEHEGAAGWLDKPFTSEQVLTIVRSVLDFSSP